MYVVRAGDTLTRIAARYGVTLEQLKAANPGHVADGFTGWRAEYWTHD